MGIVYKPGIPMYWTTKELLNTPIFSKIMSRKRFQLILKFLHFNDNTLDNHNNKDRDRLHKVRPLIEIVRRRCYDVYCPDKKLSVNESLVLFKGRVKFRQYIKTKRVKFGIKLYELTTFDGIALGFFIYCGKGMYHDDHFVNLTQSEMIPVALMQQYLNKNLILFTENFCKSPTLARFLVTYNTYLVGTIRVNRKQFAKLLIDIQLENLNAAFAKLTS